MSKDLVKPTVKQVWRINGPNSVLSADDYYISYNMATGADHNPFTALGNILGEDLEDGEETALVIRGEPTIFKILSGNFRNEYEKLYPDLKASIKFFDSKKKQHGNNWSTLEEDQPGSPQIKIGEK